MLSATLLSVLAILGVGYYIVRSFLTWRRLAKVPAARWLAHVSDFRLASHTFSGRQYFMHRYLHERKGPLVRVARDMIVTNDVPTPKRLEKWCRDPYYKTGKFNSYHENLFSRLKLEEHQRAKSRTLAAYSGRDTPDLEVGVNELVQTLIQTIETKYCNQGGKYLDLHKSSNFFTLDVIMTLAFGKALPYLKEEKDRFGFLRSLHDLWPQMSTCADPPILRKVLFLEAFLKIAGPEKKDRKGFGALMGGADQQVSKRFEKDAKPRADMLGSMIKHGLDQEECETEGLFMIIARTESTVSAIRSVLLHTVTMPSVYSRLKQEIDEAVREGKVSDPISMQEARRLPYLQAVIYEALRMRPLLVAFFSKVVPPEGANILGYDVPEARPQASTCPLSPFRRISSARMRTSFDWSGSRSWEMRRRGSRWSGMWSWRLDMGSGLVLGRGGDDGDEQECLREQIFRHFDLQLVRPFAPSEILTYGTFLEEGLRVKVAKVPGMHKEEIVVGDVALD